MPAPHVLARARSAPSPTPPAAPTRRWRPTPGLGRAIALLCRAVPRSLRLAAATRLAILVSMPLRRGSWPWLRLPKYRINSISELALYRILNALTMRGVEFDLTMALRNETLIRDAAARGRGVLLISVHWVLGCLVIRWLFDEALRPAVVAAAREYPLLGRVERIPAMAPTPTLLLRARRSLARGEVVCAMIDRDAPTAGESTVSIATGAGPIVVSDALVRSAVASGAAVVFVHVGLEAGRVVATFGGAASSDESTDAPTDGPTDGPTAEGVLAAFGDFVRERVRAGAPRA